MKIKVDGVWKEVDNTYAKINGEWKRVDNTYTKVNGVWQSTYNIPYSCRFDSGDSCYSLDSTATLADDNDNVTLSFWYKRASSGAWSIAFSGFYNTNNWFNFGFRDTDYVFMQNYFGGTNVGVWTSDDTFTNTTDWGHLVMWWETGNATPADRFKVWHNGSELSGTLSDAITQGCQLLANTTPQIAMGYSRRYSSYYFDGLLAEAYIIDGSLIPHTDFGQFQNGVWIPKSIKPTYGSAGIKLDFADNTNFGKDTSGNNNNMTDTNLGTDHQSTDTPTS